MSVWNVQNGRVLLEPEEEQNRSEHLTELLKKLSHVLYGEFHTEAFSAMVPLLAYLLSDMKDPLSEVETCYALLQELVRMNVAEPGVPHVVHRR